MSTFSSTNVIVGADGSSVNTYKNTRVSIIVVVILVGKILGIVVVVVEAVVVCGTS